VHEREPMTTSARHPEDNLADRDDTSDLVVGVVRERHGH
jgi:hypothetical protein